MKEGTSSPLICYIMIDKIKVLDIVRGVLDGTDKFLVNMKVTPDNRIYIDIDGDEGIDIDDCIEISRTVENSLNRDEEDFELTVSSAGADSPLKMPRQYKKNEGRKLEVVTQSGMKIEGILTESDGEGFTIETPKSKKEPAAAHHFNYDDIKTARVVIQF